MPPRLAPRIHIKSLAWLNYILGAPPPSLQDWAQDSIRRQFAGNNSFAALA